MDAAQLKNLALETRADITTLNAKTQKNKSTQDFLLGRVLERQAQLAEGLAELIEKVAALPFKSATKKK